MAALALIHSPVIFAVALISWRPTACPHYRSLPHSCPRPPTGTRPAQLLQALAASVLVLQPKIAAGNRVSNASLSRLVGRCASCLAPHLAPLRRPITARPCCCGQS